MKRVLFVCIHNAGRSQMAAAFFNKIAGERGLGLLGESAGTDPGTGVHPEVIEVMKEEGIDLSEQHPKLLTNEMVEAADRVFSMGCSIEEACPAVFFPNLEDWALEDPKGKPIQRVREIRNDIRKRVENLIEGLESRT